MTATSYGFIVRGCRWATRRLVDHAAALAGYAGCDPRADIGREAYLIPNCLDD